MTIDDNTAIVARENHPFVFTVNGVRFFPGADAKLSYRSMGIDTAHLSGLPPGLIKPNDTVEVYYLGNRVFTGTAEKIINHQRSGRDRSETVLCHGPWGKMNRFVFRQQWCAGTKNNQSYTFSSSRVILNQSALGVRMSMSEQLHEIATFAQDVCGFCIGDISASSLCLPLDETRDITCASAIQRELRFFPKKVVSFDYSHNPPALNITDPDTSTDSPYIATIPQSQRSYEYTAHPIASVDISTELVELETSSDKVNSILRSLKHQVYPANADTDDIDCLKVFIPLQKGSASTSWESFESVTESIPSLNDASWWKSKHPRLANVDINQIEIRDAFRTDDNAYPNIAAATSDQLEAAGLSCEVSRFTCTCKITTEDDIEDDIILTMDFLTTDATTRTYTWQTGSSFTEGESLPEGLAKAIFEQRSGKLLNEDIAIRLGNEFPHLGDTVDGLILQSFEIDCCDLEASLHFGHPEHLSVEDMRDLLNGFRQRASASNAVMRTGEPPEEDADEQGSIQPIGSTEFSPGKKYKTTIGGNNGLGKISFETDEDTGKIVIKHGNKSITLDIKDIPSECAGNFKFHEIKYKDKQGNEQVYHGLFCDDIDLTDMAGKAIRDVDVQAVPGNPAQTTITFLYTDDTKDTFSIAHGLKGRDGDKGEDGDTPSITAEKDGGITKIYADGNLIATIHDGTDPEITAEKEGSTTTIYVNGKDIAQIEDGGVGDFTPITCISGLRFELSNGKLKCILSKQKFNVPNTVDLQPAETRDAQTIDICDIHDVEVVTSESYSPKTHQFTNTRRKITVLGDEPSTGQTPFTATPLSGE